MEPATLLFALLNQAPDVVALLGAGPGGVAKLYPVLAPQGTPRPYVCYQVISGVPEQAMGCELPDTARVQVSCFADRYDQACALQAACRRALAGQQVGTVSITADLYLDHFHDGQLCYYRTQDFLLEGLSA